MNEKCRYKNDFFANLKKIGEASIFSGFKVFTSMEQNFFIKFSVVASTAFDFT